MPRGRFELPDLRVSYLILSSKLIETMSAAFYQTQLSGHFSIVSVFVLNNVRD